MNMSENLTDKPETESNSQGNAQDGNQTSKKPASKKAKKARKKAAKKKATKKAAKKAGGPGGAGPRPFPAETLEEAIRIPRLIRELNGGNPWPPSELAGALGLAPKQKECGICQLVLGIMALLLEQEIRISLLLIL
jgi:hypothetical protein